MILEHDTEDVKEVLLTYRYSIFNTIKTLLYGLAITLNYTILTKSS